MHSERHRFAARIGALILLAGAAIGCSVTEPREAAEARSRKALLEAQIAGLEQNLASVSEKGISKERLLVAVDEAVFRDLVSVALPQKLVLAERFELTLERAEAYFRYATGVVAFDGRIALRDRPNVFIAVRLAGGLDRVDLAEGRLSARVTLYYFEVIGSTLGDLGKSVVEGIVRENLGKIAGIIPPIAIPVEIDQGVRIKGLSEGPVSAAGGVLPFSASIARFVSVDGRLWIAIEIGVGPWKAAAEAEAPASPSPEIAPAPPSPAPKGAVS